MPGLPLTTAWAEEEAPCLFYCAAGPRLAAGAEVPQHVETSAEGCDAAMACVRSRGGDGTTGRSRGGEGSRLCDTWDVSPLYTSDGVHWRVFTLHSQHMVVTLVASARFCSCAGREVASKVCAMVAPVAAACAASAAHSAACRALLAREVAAAHAERRGLAAPRARAAGCALCGVAFAADTLRGQNGHDATNGGRAVNCAVCGDVVCTDCATAHDGASAVPFSLRCGDCEHCMLTGRRLLRLRPQQAGDATRFALAALFGEHATDDRVDEFQFLDFVAAAARHPLVVDERSLDREARANGGMKHMVALDVDELGLSFRAACSQGEDTLDALAAQACLSRACAPQWRSLNTPQGEKDESDESGDESDAEASWALAPLHCAPDGAPLPRGLPESVDAPASKKRTGWGALASRDGTSVRVWLELDDSEPQCLTYTRHEAVFARRTLLFLRDVASIRCEEKCTLDLRRRAGGALQLRFEAPAATCSWWASLADSRHAARAEASRFAARDAASENAWPDAAPSGWYQRVASSFTRTTGLQLPGADGTAEGQERPFLSLAPLSAPSSAPLRASEPATELGDSLPERALALAGPDVKAAYQNLIKVIIRPPRAFYDEQRLGVADFSVRQKGGKTGVAVHREDLRVTNERGLEVRASIWVPIVDSEEPPPCVVFVHGNACNRLGALPLLRPLSLGGMSLCAIDCCGSGNSGGEFVSLGHYERDDVAAVVDELRRRQLVGRVALWGRSMGASTALLYAATRDPCVAAVVADSPYASLVQLCRELVAKARAPAAAVANAGGEAARVDLVTAAVTEAALGLVRASVRHRAAFDIYDVAPERHVANLRHSATPALFMHGALDDFVAPRHARQLHAAHGGDSALLLLPCDHQAERPASAIAEACLFVYDRLAPRNAASSRAHYVKALRRLADDGHLGPRDAVQPPAAAPLPARRAHLRRPGDRPEGDGGSGMGRARQQQIGALLSRVSLR